jgi:hypothetical protein
MTQPTRADHSRLTRRRTASERFRNGTGAAGVTAGLAAVSLVLGLAFGIAPWIGLLAAVALIGIVWLLDW